MKKSTIKTLLMPMGIVLMIVGMTMMTSCGGGKKQNTADTWEELSVNVEKDTTVYGICGESSAMNTLQLITDNGDTLTLSTTNAKENKMVLGGYNVGDMMAVLYNRPTMTLTQSVNLNVLMGEWVNTNPVDGTSLSGIEIKDGGIAESINQSNIIYRTWRMFNGKLVIMSQREGGGELEEEETYQLMLLTTDSLVYRDAEQTYEYSRPGMEENYDELGVDLEEDSFDDFIM